MMASKSKSFRAILPALSDEEVQRLQAWSIENCAAATVFREPECVVWLASKERARSREAFLRSARGVLKRLAIDVTRLRGQWLVLAEDSVVRAEAARRPTATPPATVATPPATVAQPPCHLRDGDNERVIVLSGPRQNYARPAQVFKEE